MKSTVHVGSKSGPKTVGLSDKVRVGPDTGGAVERLPDQKRVLRPRGDPRVHEAVYIATGERVDEREA